MVGQPTLVRWYIDTRAWEELDLDLPLIHTLTQSDQDTVRKYYHTSDKRMSLASQLLKYFFIHLATGVRWDEIEIQRTPIPENRPFYSRQVDFNVSHQAGLTVLTGTRAAETATSNSVPRVGVDVTCVNEPARRRDNQQPKTLAELATFVDVFTEVLSSNEIEAIKNPINTILLAHNRCLTPLYPNENNEETLASYGLRLFYCIWALKEAYLKMTGDGILAPWIRELEFFNVIPPPPVPRTFLSQSPFYGDESELPSNAIQKTIQDWGPPQNDIKITLKGKPIENVRLQLVGFQDDYFVATAASGQNIGTVSNAIINKYNHHIPGYITILENGGRSEIRIAPVASREIGDRDPWRVHSAISDPWLPMQAVSVNLDIRPCAEGRCSHLSDPRSIFA